MHKFAAVFMLALLLLRPAPNYAQQKTLPQKALSPNGKSITVPDFTNKKEWTPAYKVFIVVREADQKIVTEKELRKSDVVLVRGLVFKPNSRHTHKTQLVIFHLSDQRPTFVFSEWQRKGKWIAFLYLEDGLIVAGDHVRVEPVVREAILESERFILEAGGCSIGERPFSFKPIK